MINNLKMTVLSDNIASGSCKAEWGLCILIEADGQKIFDFFLDQCRKYMG